MTRDEYRELQEQGQTGMTPQADAAPTEPTEVVTTENNDIPIEASDTPSETLEVQTEETYDDVPPEQKTAFQKALERERTKAREKLETEFKEQYEKEVSVYKKVFTDLGTTPEQIMEAARIANEQKEAKILADQNGWDEDQTKWYMDQQKKDRKLRDLEIQVQINDMADSPDYIGIKAMKPQLTEFMRNNPNMSVKESYWAIGGEARIKQAEREAEQRAIAKRQEQRLANTSGGSVVAQPSGVNLTAQDVKIAKQIGVTEGHAKKLIQGEQQGAFKDLKSFREWKSKQPKAR